MDLNTVLLIDSLSTDY